MAFRATAAVSGIALLACLISRVGPGHLLENISALGWGLVLIVALGGVAHLVKDLGLATHAHRLQRRGFIYAHAPAPTGLGSRRPGRSPWADASEKGCESLPLAIRYRSTAAYRP